MIKSTFVVKIWEVTGFCNEEGYDVPKLKDATDILCLNGDGFWRRFSKEKLGNRVKINDKFVETQTITT